MSISVRLCVCVCVALLALSAIPAEGKGYYGYGYRSITGYGVYGAGFGGGYRSYRYGAYSPYTRYYVYPVIWTHGTHQRGYKDPAFETQLEDVMCKRNLTVTYSTTATSAQFLFDSRRQCFHQLSPEPGAPDNTPMTGLFIDVFQWNVTVQQGGALSVVFKFYADETAMVTPDFTYTTNYNNVTFAGVTSVVGDLFDYSQTQPPILSTNAMANLLTAGVQSADQKTYATFQVSDDFVEDATGHIFYRPDVLALTFNLNPPTGTSTAALGVSVVTDKSKDSYYASATVGTVYNPPQMDRVSIGNMADEAERQRGYISWRRTSQLWRPCLAGTWDSQCITTGCEAGNTSDCGVSPGVLGDTGFNFNLKWNTSSTGTNPQFEANNIRMHVGYVDITTVADAAVLARPAVALLLICALAAMMML